MKTFFWIAGVAAFLLVMFIAYTSYKAAKLSAETNTTVNPPAADNNPAKGAPATA